MNKPKSNAVRAARPQLGGNVIVRSPFFQRLTAGLIVGLYDDDSEEVIVEVFPVGRASMQIPAIPFFASEPAADVRSAAWPARS